jgi:hypothetical protein
MYIHIYMYMYIYQGKSAQSAGAMLRRYGEQVTNAYIYMDVFLYICIYIYIYMYS